MGGGGVIINVIITSGRMTQIRRGKLLKKYTGLHQIRIRIMKYTISVLKNDISIVICTYVHGTLYNVHCTWISAK